MRYARITFDARICTLIFILVYIRELDQQRHKVPIVSDRNVSLKTFKDSTWSPWRDRNVRADPRAGIARLEVT